MKIVDLPIISIEDCYNKTDVLRKLKLPGNGTSMKKVEEYLQLHSLNTSHFKKYTSKLKYRKVTKECPICNKDFLTQEGHPKEKTTCSKGCSNTYFRSKENSPNFKTGKTIYRKYTDLKECNRCGYNEHPQILQVHHIDRNRDNNKDDNLEVLCPNCHTLDHYLNNDGVFTH